MTTTTSERFLQRQFETTLVVIVVRLNMKPIHQQATCTWTVYSRCLELFMQQHQLKFSSSLRAWRGFDGYGIQHQWPKGNRPHHKVQHFSFSAETDQSQKMSLNRSSGPHMIPSSSKTSTTRSSVESSSGVSNSIINNSDQIISRIMSGGTPCDPAPPPFQLTNFGEDSLYTLVLLRHGESEWNLENKYTGWCDVL
jgi:hypothetical protein